MECLFYLFINGVGRWVDYIMMLEEDDNALKVFLVTCSTKKSMEVIVILDSIVIILTNIIVIFIIIIVVFIKTAAPS